MVVQKVRDDLWWMKQAREDYLHWQEHEPDNVGAVLVAPVHH